MEELLLFEFSIPPQSEYSGVSTDVKVFWRYNESEFAMLYARAWQEQHPGMPVEVEVPGYFEHEQVGWEVEEKHPETGVLYKIRLTAYHPFAEMIGSEPAPEPTPEPSPDLTCEASFSFSIEPVRQPRFILEFDDLKGNVHRVEWLQPGYTGAPEYLCGGGDPVKTEYPGVGNKHSVLHGSSTSITLKVKRYGLLQEFFTADERKFRVDHYFNDKLIWQGYHMADVYSEPWVSVPFDAILLAYDGIGALENMPYLNPAGERYYGRARSIDVIFRILRKLDLTLPVWLAVNVWEDTMDLGVEPLGQSYVDQSAYYSEENEPLTCREVLERILQPYAAFIKQAHGALHIIRFDETKAAYRRRKALIGKGDSGVVLDVEEEEFEEVHHILPEGVVAYRDKAQAVYARPAYKYVTVKTEYGDYENFILNGDFERWVDSFPMFWKGEAEVERLIEGDKFSLGFKNLNGNRTIASEAYDYEVQSKTGFTFKFDYLVEIDDFARDTNSFNAWVLEPLTTLQNNTFSVSSPEVGKVPSASFNGTVVSYPLGVVKSGISPAGQNQYRVDAVVALPNGTFQYIDGVPTAFNQDSNIPALPANSILVTYITWTSDKATFCSVNEHTSALFRIMIRIGEHSAALAFTRRGLQSTLGWTLGQSTIRRAAQNPKIEEGYAIMEGTIEIHIGALTVPGIPYVSIQEPQLNRNELSSVKVSIDNVVFTERSLDNIQRMTINGENGGKINTKPFELTLRHGSGIPRTQALLTLADGSPAQYWNGGKLLQELTARDILAQHKRATLVLTATLAGPVSPISILKDPFLPGSRFLVDRFVHSARSGKTEIEAQEVFGGAEDASQLRITEDNRPRITESGNYRILE